MTVDPMVNVVVVTWNNAATIAGCLASVARQRGVAARIIVIDNASSDGTWDILAEALPAVERIQTGANLGFARAVNLGAGTTSDGPVLLLNPDTELLGADVLATALRVLHSEASVGTVGIRLLNPDGSLQVSAYGRPTLWREAGEALFLYRLLPPWMRGRIFLGSHWDHASRREVGWLLGAFLLIRRANWDACGGLTEDFHMFAEDLDWGVRSGEAGWTSVFTPEAEAVHLANHSGSQRWISPAARSITSFRSYYRYLRSRHGVGRVGASLLINLLGFSLRAAIYAVRARDGSAQAAYWRQEYRELTRFHLRELAGLARSTTD